MKSLTIRRSISRVTTSRATTLGVAAVIITTCGLTTSARAHHPDRENQRVTPIIDVIGPLGNRLPPSHRKKYNRPSYIAGKIAYHIAPSSQEAMVWHRAVHAGAYKHPKKCYRLETHYFYPKPWEALRVGPRVSKNESALVANPAPPINFYESDDGPQMLETQPLTPDATAEPPITAPEADPTLELPELKLDDPIESPSDVESPSAATPEPKASIPPSVMKKPVIKKAEVEPSAIEPSAIETAVPRIEDGSSLDADFGIRTAFGKLDQSQVSQASVFQSEHSLSVADRPVFLRRMVRR